MDFSGNLDATLYIENFPLDMSEGQILNICRKVGNVIRFRLIQDDNLKRFNGKILCEFGNPLLALSAKRYLNDIKLGSTYLKSDMLKNKPKEIIRSYSKEVIEEEKQEDSVISQAVASLPPEQMYELMKQMKLCIQNNPMEARNMLLQNHQLAYALLQAQIVMKIVDPKVAIAILNRSNDQIPDGSYAYNNNNQDVHIKQTSQQTSNFTNPSVFSSTSSISISNLMSNTSDQSNINGVSSKSNDINNVQRKHFSTFPDLPLPYQKIVFQNSQDNPTTNTAFNKHGYLDKSYTQSPDIQIQGKSAPTTVSSNDIQKTNMIPIKSENNLTSPSSSPSKLQTIKSIADHMSEHDERKKTDLIMQVLKLTNEEIALLPEDQRASIIILKEQLSNS